jgi:hypothetical protein
MYLSIWLELNAENYVKNVFGLDLKFIKIDLVYNENNTSLIDSRNINHYLELKSLNGLNGLESIFDFYRIGFI